MPGRESVPRRSMHSKRRWGIWARAAAAAAAAATLGARAAAAQLARARAAAAAAAAHVTRARSRWCWLRCMRAPSCTVLNASMRLRPSASRRPSRSRPNRSRGRCGCSSRGVRGSLASMKSPSAHTSYCSTTSRPADTRCSTARGSTLYAHDGRCVAAHHATSPAAMREPSRHSSRDMSRRTRRSRCSRRLLVLTPCPRPPCRRPPLLTWTRVARGVAGGAR
jgi:hypothetical protein